MKQESFTDIEHSYRKKKTKREEFLEIMDEIIPWDEWVGVIKPCYPEGKRGRPPMGIEKMLRRYLLQIWFNLSDPATEDAKRQKLIEDGYRVSGPILREFFSQNRPFLRFRKSLVVLPVLKRMLCCCCRKNLVA